MREVTEISVAELRLLAGTREWELVKADVDVGSGRLVVDMEMHVDGEQFLLSNGSRQEDIWGINLYPDFYGAGGFVEFDSVINLRPRQNRSRGVDDPVLRDQILDLVARIVHE